MSRWRILLLLSILALAALLPLRRASPPGGGLAAPPAPLAASAAALGDPALAHRWQGLRLQLGGDWGGRITPVADYDYGRVGRWLALLDRLDPGSGYGPALAAYLYGQTRKPDQLAVVLDYLKGRAQAAPARDWPWLVHGVYLARSRLADPAIGRDLALDLARLDGPPDWTRTLALALSRHDGDKAAAAAALAAIKARGPLSPQEARFVEQILRQAQ